jgi:hypothetical protein
VVRYEPLEGHDGNGLIYECPPAMVFTGSDTYPSYDTWEWKAFSDDIE